VADVDGFVIGLEPKHTCDYRSDDILKRRNQPEEPPGPTQRRIAFRIALDDLEAR
jgi:hypothetical protein